MGENPVKLNILKIVSSMINILINECKSTKLDKEFVYKEIHFETGELVKTKKKSIEGGHYVKKTGVIIFFINSNFKFIF